MPRPARTPDTAFWVDRADVEEGSGRLRLSADESRHLLRVFRAAPGTPFEAVDGLGVLYRCVLESQGQDGAAVGRIESRREEAGELPFGIAVLVGLPDLSQAETIVDQAVALGAARIDFAVTARSGPGPLSRTRLERLERIARSALKQSRRTRLPVVLSSGDVRSALGSALAAAPGTRFRLLADPGGEPPREPAGVGDVHSSQPSILLAVGPPGGYSPEERELLLHEDFLPISLGPSRLTTSTAAVALLVAARNLMTSMGLARVDKTDVSGYR